MRVLPILGLLAVTLLAACSGTSEEESSEGDNALAAPAEGACSLAYWDWLTHKLEPRLALPIGEASDEQLNALVASHPPAEYTEDGYGVCWSFVFAKHFVGPATQRLHQAGLGFIDQRSGDYRNYDRYRANMTMTPELRRNAKALLALRPSTMKPTDMDLWASAYNAILAEVIRPVAIPGPQSYVLVAENEWVITDAEAAYLTVAEGARGDSTADSAYADWVRNYGKWLFGPPPAVTNSFVFNLTFESGALIGDYGLSGVVLEGGVPVLPSAVKSFLGRVEATKPRAIGSQDSSAWMILYYGRAFRTIGDLPQNQPILTQTDTLALDVLERVRPERVRGHFAWETWLDLVVLAAPYEASWSRRFLASEPCLDSADLAAANRTFTEKTAALGAHSIPAPHACPN
jgi:hypothetical protein